MLPLSYTNTLRSNHLGDAALDLAHNLHDLVGDLGRTNLVIVRHHRQLVTLCQWVGDLGSNLVKGEQFENKFKIEQLYNNKPWEEH